ncbi:hypothetical protein GDO78_013375 [Eleutherodactylus coqui]|uniref:Uncharacterized protein n=1 Tax=Eleutherodactylus coqui TaxID=57060 RepID=A0A8J6K3I9_ELECQ|nr:hypothetical protein GDO78_013375 [Eleutherodactylus coqui]
MESFHSLDPSDLYVSFWYCESRSSGEVMCLHICRGNMLMFDANTMVFSIFGCLSNALHGLAAAFTRVSYSYTPHVSVIRLCCISILDVRLIPSDAFTTAVYIGLTKTPLMAYPDVVPVFIR